MTKTQKKLRPRCPDYTDACIQKLGVIVCAQVTHKNQVKCPIIRYIEDEEGDKEGVNRDE